MKDQFQCYSETTLQKAIGFARKAFRDSGYVSISVSDSKPRSLNQNALSHDWYEQVSRELGEHTAEQVKAECKLTIGVPILRLDDPEFKAIYDSALKGLGYEQKLAVMRYFPVTGLMNTAQLSRYLEQVQKTYSGRVDLRFPDEMARAA